MGAIHTGLFDLVYHGAMSLAFKMHIRIDVSNGLILLRQLEGAAKNDSPRN